ncbi:hypothetical protein [Paenibacillus sp. FSL R10-2734]|uniref:hypothetical protein n=1 Tax=Paenibacillus sp. FSL R10-2734 TaxID=2954691 RepID=UPI0030DC2A1E
MKTRLILDLQLFADEDPGVESAPAAEVSTETATPEVEIPETVSESETGVEEQVAAEPEKQNNFEKAFAKRLAAERSKWDSETAEKYKDYDTHKELSQYLQEINGADALTLKEQIEMSRLQNRAEANEISPDMQKKLEYLEEKAAKADKLEEKQQEEQRIQTYFSTLEGFAKDKGVDSEKLNAFMVENELTYDPANPEKSFNLAHKAMRADELEQQLSTAKETAVKEYLQSKSAPRVEGSGTPGVVTEDTSKMGWKDINERIVARMNAANQSQ